MDASRVYVRALALGFFYSHISTRTFRKALTASLDSCAEIKIECPFSGVTKSCRVWRKVPESDVRSVGRGRRGGQGRGGRGEGGKGGAGERGVGAVRTEYRSTFASSSAVLAVLIAV